MGIRRSLVYGWLLAAGLAVYAGVVLVLDAVLRGHAQPVVTLVGGRGRRGALSAAAAAPATRGGPDALRRPRRPTRLASLGRRLQAAGSAEQTLPETVETIAAALRLPYVAVELPGDLPRSRPPCTDVDRPRAGGLPLTTAATVGRLVVARRDTRDEPHPAERRLSATSAARWPSPLTPCCSTGPCDGPGNGW